MPIHGSKILDKRFLKFIILEKVVLIASNFSIGRNTFNPLPHNLRVTAHLRMKKTRFKMKNIFYLINDAHRHELCYTTQFE